MKRWVWLSHRTRSSTVLCLCARAPNPLALRWIQHPCRPHRVDSCITQTLFVHISSGSHIKKRERNKNPAVCLLTFCENNKALCHLLLCCSNDLSNLPEQSLFYFNKSWLRKVNPSISTVMWMASRSVQVLRHLQTDSFRAQCVQKLSNRYKTHSSSPSRSVFPLRHLVSRLPLSPSN